MYSKPKESDWKVFRKRVAEWRERYLAKKNLEITATLTDETKTPTERFWNTKYRMDKEAKILVDCLDRHSRSKMLDSLVLMHGYGLVVDSDLNEFSEEFRERLLWIARGYDAK